MRIASKNGIYGTGKRKGPRKKVDKDWLGNGMKREENQRKRVFQDIDNCRRDWNVSET